MVFAPASGALAQDTPFTGDLHLPGIVNYAPANVSAGALALGNPVDLFLDAKLADETDVIEKGLIWRVFGSVSGPDGKLPLLATAKGGSTRMQLSPGSYLVHAAFGRAGATTRITLTKDEPRHESMVLNAGGLRLEGVLPDNIPMREDQLTFNIYDAKEGPEGERQLILPDVKPGRTVRLNAGTYHVVSNYGDVNATIRADIRVEAGKTTTAKVEHRAAQVTLNLVRGEGGFPLADTAWSVLGASGDIIAENVGAFPTMILAAGDYTVIAKNKNRVFQRDITIRPAATSSSRSIRKPPSRFPTRSLSSARRSPSKRACARRGLGSSENTASCTRSSSTLRSWISRQFLPRHRPSDPCLDLLAVEALEFADQQRHAQRQRELADEVEQPAVLAVEIDRDHRGCAAWIRRAVNIFHGRSSARPIPLWRGGDAAGRKDHDRHAFFQQPHGFLARLQIERESPPSFPRNEIGSENGRISGTFSRSLLMMTRNGRPSCSASDRKAMPSPMP